MAYAFIESRIMPRQSVASVVSTTAAVPVGTIVRAKDPTLGEGEFIYLPTNASVAVGNLMAYRQGASVGAAVTVKVPSAANYGGQVAVAMAAGQATSFGWFQISGTAPLLKSAVILSANKPVFISTTAGRIRAVLSAGRQVLGIISGAAAVSATSTVVCTFNRPFMQGNAT
jgi:hypothetical protein